MRESTLAPVSESYAQLEPGQFRTVIDQSWEAASRLKDAVADQVESETISPLTGAGIVACITGQVFGYQEFHKELRPSDLVQALKPR